MQSLTCSRDLDAPPAAVRDAAESLTYEPVLDADRAKGEELGLRGTPQVYVNGEPAEDFAYGTVSDAIGAARSE